MLELVDVHTYYGQSYVLQGVSMRVQEGCTIALLGRNGVGKTTTIRTIIGFTPPRRGKIYFMEKNIVGLQSYDIARMGVGVVPQGRHVFPSLSVEENLLMPARTVAKGKGWSLQRVYSLFPILKERAKCASTVLSGGEQQMLTIARALMTNPDLLLMDEPSEGLAPMIVREVGRIICQLKETGLSILLVEQNLPLALGMADYVYIMGRGVIVYESSPERMINNEEVKAQYLA